MANRLKKPYQAQRSHALGEFLFFTTEQVYQQIERINFPELSDQTWLRIYVADLTLRDIGWYLAYTPEEKSETPEHPEEATGEQSIGLSGSSPSEFSLYPYGLPNYEQKIEETTKTGSVNPAWNSLVLRHLIEVGAKPEAAELLQLDARCGSSAAAGAPPI